MRCGVVVVVIMVIWRAGLGWLAYMCAMSEGRRSLTGEAPSAWIEIVGEARRVLMLGFAAAWPTSRELVMSLLVRSVGGASRVAAGGAVAVTGSVMVAELLLARTKNGRVSNRLRGDGTTRSLLHESS